MHRGSSKGDRVAGPAPESLPLSASPAPTVRVSFEVTRAAGTRRLEVEVPLGTVLRDALRRVGMAPEGVAVLVDDRPVPLDVPLSAPTRVTVVPTFSGG